MNKGIQVRQSFTINASPEELFEFWRRFSNFPRFMKHVISVEDIDGNRSHWVVKAPAGRTVEWDAEIVEDVPGESSPGERWGMPTSATEAASSSPRRPAGAEPSSRSG